MRNPLKQGLKQMGSKTTQRTETGRNAKSTKTRIETPVRSRRSGIYFGRNAKSTKTRIETAMLQCNNYL